jgi:hypothetical protein
VLAFLSEQLRKADGRPWAPRNAEMSDYVWRIGSAGNLRPLKKEGRRAMWEGSFPMKAAGAKTPKWLPLAAWGYTESAMREEG